METRRWINQSQPQTLYMATILLYVSAAIGAFFSLAGGSAIGLLYAAGEGGAAYGIANERRWGPRTLDLDMLAYDDVKLDKPELTLPHPHLFERAFVLVPLAEIAPDRLIAGQTPRQALARLSVAGIERLPDET